LTLLSRLEKRPARPLSVWYVRHGQVIQENKNTNSVTVKLPCLFPSRRKNNNNNKKQRSVLLQLGTPNHCKTIPGFTKQPLRLLIRVLLQGNYKSKWHNCEVVNHLMCFVSGYEGSPPRNLVMRSLYPPLNLYGPFIQEKFLIQCLCQIYTLFPTHANVFKIKMTCQSWDNKAR
jgi:hypothetical protein